MSFAARNFLVFAVTALLALPAGPALALGPEAGFMELAPFSYTLAEGGVEMKLTTSHARIWHAFRPAESEPEKKPLAVLFNGGPGCASATLFGFNTSRYTIDPQLTGGKRVAVNPHSWDAFANLLYIDARGTGFSYMREPGASQKEVRKEAFSARNFNPFVDGADYVRVLLRFLGGHPAIRGNPVIIVGESYGGIRATVMLHMLLNYRNYADGWCIYQDPELVAAIQAHYDAVFPEHAGTAVPRDVAAGQFGRQVLIEPAISLEHQFAVTGSMWTNRHSSIIYRIAAETGAAYTPCGQGDGQCDEVNNALDYVQEKAGRDIYRYQSPANWSFGLNNRGTSRLLFLDAINTMTGCRVQDVGGMYAASRQEAVRMVETDGSAIMGAGAEPLLLRPYAHRLLLEHLPADLSEPTEGEFPEVFGELNKWDRYFIGCQYEITNAYYDNGAVSAGLDVSPRSGRFGVMFLQNLILTKTFITDSAFDLVIYQPALARALAGHSDIVGASAYSRDVCPTCPRPGGIVLDYRKWAFIDRPSPGRRTIRFPHYAESGHMVEISQPGDFYYDVRQWLGQ